MKTRNGCCQEILADVFEAYVGALDIQSQTDPDTTVLFNDWIAKLFSLEVFPALGCMVNDAREARSRIPREHVPTPTLGKRKRSAGEVAGASLVSTFEPLN